MDLNDLSRLWGGFKASRVLLTANNYKVFDRLEKPVGADELSAALKLDRRATRILLDALTSLGLLKKTKDKYKNTPVASRHLVTGKAEYQGDIIRHAGVLWENWSALDEIMVTGLPARRAHDHKSFISGMHNIAQFRVAEVIKTLNLRGAKTVLDLGGGPGTYAISFARKGLDVTLYDRPETMRIARESAKKAGVKIKFRKGDFITDPIGKGFDLVFISQIFHAYSAEDNVSLLEKCRVALNSGGRVVVQEMPISDDMASPAQSALFSVNMLVNTLGGRCYALNEIKGWLKQAGFEGIRQMPTNDTVLIEGTASL